MMKKVTQMVSRIVDSVHAAMNIRSAIPRPKHRTLIFMA